MNDPIKDLPILAKLQQWFSHECNEDWEHSFGFRLETLDNPGWTFEADLEETRWSGARLVRERIDRSKSDWFQYEIESNQYVSSGGVFNLEEMLQKFFEVLETLETD